MTGESLHAAGFEPLALPPYLRDRIEAAQDDITDTQDELDTLFDGVPESLQETLNDLRFTVAMITDRIDYIERVANSMQSDVRYLIAWADRNERE